MAGFQQTIAEIASISGTGLHTGVDCVATFRPAETDQGIRFTRADLPDSPEIPADIEHVADISRGTTLEVDGVRVHTVEHILAAAAGLGIDNLIVELSEKEPPVMDGSARPFVEVLLKAGIVRQNAPRRTLVVDQTVSFADPDAGIDLHVLPADDFRITFMMDYGHLNQLATQFMSVYAMHEDFVERIAPARTFCLLSEVLELYEQGLAKGGSLENAVVFVDQEPTAEEMLKMRKIYNITGDISPGENGILKGQELRFENEAVRHKVLDLIGDLALLGMPIQGHVVATRSGHKSNIELVRKLRKVYGKRFKSQNGQAANAGPTFDIKSILDALPHRYPMLLIDRVLEVDPGKRVRALKNVSINEPHFQGHFPGQPVMPGVLILEAMAQAGGFLLLNEQINPATKLVYFSAIDKARFRQAVRPGDQLILEVELLRIRLSTAKMAGRAFVDGKLVAEAELMATIVDREG
ncbi:MAG: bifunctional UDP-3-O-[3-hydroxymyristoyl] N-acetylglucosamine deacetylase/3-hydroxyacyl-ACP dehydratase [Candidatus Marinimicrobia bacterium]|nr:bifunctional UDP-3-O-[3-hydroxymyristoyl] N-acetylglucosamine deacetylase/3-hydroxyacyl-ACP dehydratase [Candidatus Neomarinimicrobiota bacterium]